jgi:hypothetical protein
LRSNTKCYGGKTRYTNSQNSDTTAPSARELYHSQFTLQAANPETFGYTFLFIDFKKVCDPVKREVLYHVVLGFGTPKKLVGIIKIYLNETYSEVRAGKLLTVHFLFRMA